MQRCLQLASLGAGKVAPNPMVGAVLVYGGRIIGEGYHQQFGEAHAEVNCVNSVAVADQEFINRSTLYVSLEPCTHFGKTPPCTDLIIKNKIPHVVIGCLDSFIADDTVLSDKMLQGKGMAKLKAAGVDVVVGILEDDCRALNSRFFTFHENSRPYIILKWAQSRDGKIARLPDSYRDSPGQILDRADAGRFLISNKFTNRLVHKWRTEESAILVGTNTALLDDPALTVRLWPGKNPLRLVIDSELRLPGHLKLFDGSTKTIVFNYIKQEQQENLLYQRLSRTENLLTQILAVLYKMQNISLIVEGGSMLLQSFIDADLWDEARMITNTEMTINNGLAAPILKNDSLVLEQKIQGDCIAVFKNG